MNKYAYLKSGILFKVLVIALFVSMANCKSYNLYRKAGKKENCGDYESANKYYNLSIEVDSIFPGTYMSRAFCFMKMGKFDMAIRDANKCIALNKKDDLAYFFRAQIKEAKGDMQGALKDYNRAIYRNKYKYCYYNYCGKLRAKLNQYEDALVYINFALKTQAYDECSTKEELLYFKKMCEEHINKN